MNQNQINLVRYNQRMDILKAGVDKRKYNVGYLRHVEEVTGDVASDERSGYDTGSALQLTNQDE